MPNICMYTHLRAGASGGQKASDALELDSQTVVSCPVTYQPLWGPLLVRQVLLTAEPSLQPTEVYCREGQVRTFSVPFSSVK